MSDGNLEPEELAALQSAMREARSGKKRAGSKADAEAVPFPLIVDDREAERARPAALKLGERWTRLAQKRLSKLAGGSFDVRVAGAEIVEGELMRDDMAVGWLSGLEVEGSDELVLLSVRGSMIETLAGRLCGEQTKEDEDDDEDDDDEEDGDEAEKRTEARTPSKLAISVFASVGRSIVESLSSAWRDHYGTRTRQIVDRRRLEGTLRGLPELDVLVSLSLEIEGAINGQIRLCARPELLAPTPQPIQAIPATTDSIQAALGAVPVEVMVELGRAKCRVSQLRNLAPGMVLKLDRFVDDPLPIRCGGVVKAVGRAVVNRGVLAVEIADPNSEPENYDE